ncbi:glycosyltransferase [Rickettsiales bacterium]|nr:glycosyltransferase [Rickettsiales bacterium]
MEIYYTTAISAWIYLIFFHGRSFPYSDHFFWSNKIVFEKKYNFSEEIKEINKQVCAIIPARNERKNITETLISLINQKSIILEVIVIDDQSTDGTKDLVVKTFKKYKFNNYKVIEGENLPIGWSGKIWALNQGMNEAIKNIKNDYVLLLDADIVIEENLVVNLTKSAMKEKIGMISLMAKLNCISFWEKILIPPFIFFFQKLYPFNYVNDSKSKIAAAAGGCIFSEISIFKKNNLFYTIKNEIIDDCNLAKQIKKKKKIWLGLTNKVWSTRNYYNLNSICSMISRCAFSQLKNSIIYLIISVLGMITLYLTGLAGILTFPFHNSFYILIISVFLTLCSLLVFFPTISFYKLNPVFLFTLPFSAVLYMFMTVISAFNFYFKDGNDWKGRKCK